MKRWSCLLLDANILIALFKAGIWDRFVAACDVHVSETVLGEAHFYEDDDGSRHDFALRPYVKDGRIRQFSVSARDVQSFVDSFDRSYAEKLDPGEAESLAHLMKSSGEAFICSADAIVFRVLGNLDRSEQGISLQEVLEKAGLSRRLPQQFSKAFRERWTHAGVTERLQGKGSVGGKAKR